MNAEGPGSGTEQPAPVPVRQGLNEKFSDFDDKAVYCKAKTEVFREDAKNFVVEFGANKCRIAWDLTAADFATLLEERGDPHCPIRWINIWNPSKQEDGVVEHIGLHYGFSTRLRKSMRSWDEDKPWLMATREDEKRRAGAEMKRSKARQKIATPARDPEWGANAQDDARISLANDAPPPSQPDPHALAYMLVQGTLNYTTVDQMADRFICIGAHWLHPRPALRQDREKAETLIPLNHWSWYALCADKRSSQSAPDTILTFHEGPYYDVPYGEPSPNSWREKELENMRSNTRKVLCQLSLEGIDEYDGKIAQLASVRRHLEAVAKELEAQKLQESMSRRSTIRPGFDVSLEDLRTIELEGSSNLFYYLFEDYTSTMPIIIQSKQRLDGLVRITPFYLSALLGILQLTPHHHQRERVLGSATVKDSETLDIVPQLYTISKELRELKHLFESYKLLIQRVLGAPSVVFDTTEGGTTALKGTRLAPTARDRFERMGDRIQLLMLNTIQEYLEEQKSLSDTYFNLTNQKDSQATAKLNRSATVLAKLSVFFLPLSFVTSVFSVQVTDLTDQYTGAMYWAFFGGTAFLSFLAVFFFGKLLEAVSDNLDSISKSIIDEAKDKLKSLGGDGRRRQPFPPRKKTRREASRGNFETIAS
ncbi:hypothetical protein GQ53DRAFT_842826 [Thozetella sp. PMI_491]|nr:hypothetical protein GQ53DRAFT_842826 [Thozetella sp. PMI_491]